MGNGTRSSVFNADYRRRLLAKTPGVLVFSGPDWTKRTRERNNRYEETDCGRRWQLSYSFCSSVSGSRRAGNQVRRTRDAGFSFRRKEARHQYGQGFRRLQCFTDGKTLPRQSRYRRARDSVSNPGPSLQQLCSGHHPRSSVPILSPLLLQVRPCIQAEWQAASSCSRARSSR